MYPTAGPLAATPKRPSAAMIWVGALLIGAGIIGGIAFVVVGFTRTEAALARAERVSLPRGGTIEIDDTDTRYVYAVGVASTTDDNVFGRPEAEVLIRITDPSGRGIPVVRTASNATFTINGEQGRLVGEFYPDVEGTYLVEAVLGDGEGRYQQLAITDRRVEGSLVAIAGGVFGGAFAVIAGVVFLVVGLVRRSRWNRGSVNPVAAAAMGGYGGYGGYGGPPPGLPGWGPVDTPAGPPGWSPPPGPVSNPIPGPSTAPVGPGPGWAPAAPPPPKPPPPAQAPPPPGVPTFSPPAPPPGTPAPPPYGGTPPPSFGVPPAHPEDPRP